MDTNIINVSLTLDGLTGSQLSETYIFNSFELQLNLNFISTTSTISDLTKIKIIFDGTQQNFEFSDIRNNYVLKKKGDFTDLKKDIIQIRLFYSNLNVFEYTMPLVFVPPSTLDFFDGATIQNAQFIDTKENDDLFFVMKNNKNQFFNFRSGSNVITYRNYLQSISAANDQIIPVIAATLSSTSVTPNTALIVNEFGEFIEVTV